MTSDNEWYEAAKKDMLKSRVETTQHYTVAIDGNSIIVEAVGAPVAYRRVFNDGLRPTFHLTRIVADLAVGINPLYKIMRVGEGDLPPALAEYDRKLH